MLSQKMTKEFLQYQKQPTEASAAALMKTVKVFDQTLAAFIGGGSTSLTLDPDSAKRQQIAAITNPEQLAQLRLPDSMHSYQQAPAPSTHSLPW